MVKALPQMVWHADAPKFNLYPWFVHRLAKRHATVCLSGLGGDEVFGGYASSNRYRYAGRFMTVSRAWPPLRAAGMVLQGAGMGTSRLVVALAAAGDPVEEYLAVTDYLPVAQMRRLLGTTEAHQWIRATFAPHFAWPADDLRDLIMEAEFHTKLPEDFLAVDDAMSMAHSLEVRVPLLDAALVEVMRRVPYRALAAGDVGKLPLRAAMAPYLPRRCFEKPKWGFSVNLQAWFAAELGEEVRRVVPESPWVRQVCDVATVREWCRQRPQSPRLPFRWGTKPAEAVLWMLLAYHHWAEKFLGEAN
jgi:asparagine synthase (glutamine-hydrolysing)